MGCGTKNINSIQISTQKKVGKVSGYESPSIFATLLNRMIQNFKTVS